MDNQPIDNKSQSSVTPILKDVFATRRSKTFLFVGSFVGSMVLITVISLFSGVMEIGDLLNEASLLTLFLSPVGTLYLIFGWLFDKSPLDLSGSSASFFDGICILWVVYYMMMITGIMGENAKTSKAIFAVFVILLFLNIVGYVVMMSPGT